MIARKHFNVTLYIHTYSACLVIAVVAFVVVVVSRDCAVGMRKCCAMYNRRTVAPFPAAYLSSAKSKPSLGLTEPPTQLVPRLFPWLKMPRSEVDHATPCSADMKNEWSYTYTSPDAGMACI